MASPPFRLTTGSQPSLDGITLDGTSLTYHEGGDQLAVQILPGAAPLRVCQNRYATVVSNRTVICLSSFQDAAARLLAWSAGDNAAIELDGRAYPRATAITASPGGRYVAFIHVSDLTGETGSLQIRRRDGSGVAVSPVELRDLDLSRCVTEVRFYDESRVAVLSCQRPSVAPRLFLADAETGAAVAIADPSRESVEQMLFAPGGRIVWTNLPGSSLDASALKSAGADGNNRLVLARNLPAKRSAQLTLSPAGTAAYYLSNSAALQKVSTSGGGELTLTSERVDRILGLSPDGAVIAVARARSLPLSDRVTAYDTASREATEVPVVPGTLGPVSFTSDGAQVLFGGGDGALYAYPVRSMGMSAAQLRPSVVRYAPIADSRVLCFQQGPGETSATALIADALRARGPIELERGLNPAPAAAQLSPDRSKLVYVRGGDIWAISLP